MLRRSPCKESKRTLSAWTDTTGDDRKLLAAMVEKLLPGVYGSKAFAQAGQITNAFKSSTWAACNLVWLRNRIMRDDLPPLKSFGERMKYLQWMAGHDIGMTPAACGGDDAAWKDHHTVSDWAKLIGVKPGKKKVSPGMATIKQALKSAIDGL